MPLIGEGLLPPFSAYEVALYLYLDLDNHFASKSSVERLEPTGVDLCVI